MDPDCHHLMVNGIEGTHYEVDDSGAITIIDQPLWEQQVQPYSGSIPTNNDTPLYRSTDEMVNLANELIAENDDYAVEIGRASCRDRVESRTWRISCSGRTEGI